MKTYSTMDSGKCGSSLLTVMILIMTISICLGIIAFTSVQRGHMAIKMGDRIRAQSLAEAGVNRGYSIIRTNWAARLNAFPLGATNYGGGAYTSYVIMASATSKVVSITCTGACRSAVADVMLNARNSGSGTGGPPVGAYACAIFCGGNMKFTGSGDFVCSNGVFHSNAQLSKTGSGGITGRRVEASGEGATSLTGSSDIHADIAIGGNLGITGSGKIYGNVQCDDYKYTGSGDIESNLTCLTYSGGTVKGTKTTGIDSVVPTMTIPDIPLNPYYDAAAAQVPSQVVSNYSMSGSSDLVIPGGILWVNGTFTCTGSGKILGCVIATGNITISGSSTVTATNGYPALVSRDGSISLTGSGNYTGLIYAKTGNFSKTGSGFVKGSIIVNGTFEATGSWGALIYQDCTPAVPGGSTGGDNVGVSAWQK
jgi:hypothetical protein